MVPSTPTATQPVARLPRPSPRLNPASRNPRKAGSLVTLAATHESKSASWVGGAGERVSGAWSHQYGVSTVS